MSKEKFVRDKPHVTIGLLITVFSILSGLSLGIVIYNDVKTRSDSDGDTVPDNAEDRAKQPLFFEATENLLSFRSYGTETTPTGGNHELGHNLDILHGGLSSHLEIRSSLYDDVSTGIPILEFGIKYESLIEFVDANSNGFFEPVVDTIVGETSLINMVRIDFGYGVEGQPSYYSGYSTIDGVFKVYFYTSREHVLLARQVGLLAPNQLKSYLTFTDYSPTTSGLNLALKLSLSSNHNLVFSSSGLSVEASTDNYKAEYEWYDWAITDGTNTTVNTTVPSSSVPSSNGVIYLNFGQFTNGTYDPKLSWHLPYRNIFNFFDLPWSYIAMGSIAILMVIVTTRVVRKIPGRVTYEPAKLSSKSKKKATKAEKRIPSTLRHRDR